VKITTTETISGAEIEHVLGMVKGNVVRARFAGRDLIAGLRTFFGGEISEYTELMSQAREQALERMVHEAELMGADAVICVRFTTSMILQGTSEILAYGTAVRLK
jgi:Uncharacterized conserved protein